LDETRIVVLQGNSHPLARPQFDQGAAPPDLPMNRILLVLKRSPDQETALQDLLGQQQATSSPNYHKWLTPDEFAQQFGPADADIQTVTSWLASHGFQSIQVSKGRAVIEFSGTAAQVESALHTPIHRYVVNGESHWANANDPEIPAALAPVVSGFVSLHDFRKKPAFVRSGRTGTARIIPGARPQITFTDGSHGLAPADFNTIYNVASTMTGSTATIGIVSDTNINLQDITDFRNLFGVPANNPNVVLNGPDPGNLLGNAETEAVVDATWAGAVAPSATVNLVVSEDTNSTNGVDLSEIYIIDTNSADVMTESIETCEANASANAAFYSGLAEQAAAQGITLVVASGDGGPDACDALTTTSGTLSAPSVNLLASTPFDVAVGGTQFNDVASPSTYWNSINVKSLSAKSYIPENAWNESCTVLSATCPAVGLWSSGGGQSALFSKPPWQAGVAGIPSANSRFLPDVSLSAADHDGYVLCVDASCHGANPSFPILSGTSVSAQAFGGIMALVVQKTGGRVGIANYALYKLAATEALSSCNGSGTPALPATGTCVFNDTTVGNTNLYSTSTTPVETGFTAGVGYDEATGLGSVNVTNLVNKWSTAIVHQSKTSLTLNGGNTVNVAHGTPVPVSITVAPVSPATGTPTGDVSLVANSTTGQGVDGFTLNNGTVNSSTIFLPGGSYQVTAHYEGDGTFTGSDSVPVSVTVTKESSITSLGIVVNGQTCATATSVTYGSPYVLSVGVIDSAGSGNVCLPIPSGATPTGNVTLTDKFNGVTSLLDGGTFKLNSGGYFEDQTIQLPAGVHNITAVYAGDNSFTTSTSNSDVVTVSKASTSINFATIPTTVPVGANVTLTATVITMSNATANASQEPTGGVQFVVNGANFGGPVTVTGGISSATGFARGIASLTTNTLPTGNDSVTAMYLGDGNYSASAVSPAVVVGVGVPGINVSPESYTATINVPALGTQAGQLITVSAANAYTGTVTLTCTVTTTMTGAAFMPTCSFTPNATITLTGATTSDSRTVNINTTVASALFKPVGRPQRPNWFVVGEVSAAMACMFLLGIAAQKRRGMAFLTMALFAVIAVGTSCKGGANANGITGGNPGTTAGAYSLNVTATPAGATAQTTTIAVIVP
jgi:hypothetical protein